MLNRLMQSASLALYSGLAKSGVLSHPAARRGFLQAYGLYKRLIEAGPVDRLRDYVPTGGIVVDIGANVGFFTLKFADWVGPTGRVFAVEPDPDNFTALGDALARSGWGARVATRRAVAAGSAGSMRLRRNEVHPGDHKIAVGAEAGIDVDAVTVDSLVDGADPDKICLMKVDVQGAEMMVLAGARRTLATPGLALFIEVDEGALRHFGSSSEDLCTFLAGLGFRMFRLSKQGAPRPLDPQALRDALAAKGYVDVLFLREETRAPRTS